MVFYAARGTKKCFSDTYCESLLKVLAVKLIKVWELACDWVPLKLSTLRLVYAEPLAIFLIVQASLCQGMALCLNFSEL